MSGQNIDLAVKDYLVSYQLTLISRLLFYKIYVKEDTDLSFTRL